MNIPEANSTPKKWKTFFVKDGRLRPIWLLLSYLPVLGLAALVVVWPVMTLLNMLGYPSLSSEQVPGNWADLARRTIDLGLVVSAVLGGTWAWRRLLWNRDMTSFGLSFHRRWLGELGIGVLTGAGFVTLVFVIEWLAGWIKVQGLAWQVRLPHEAAISLCLGIVTAIMAAVVEETLLRGFLLQTLEEGIGLPAAVIISSALFGVLHLLNPTATGWANYVIPFTITLGGFMFASAYLFSRSLWVPIGLHFAWNLFEYQVLALTGISPERASTYHRRDRPALLGRAAKLILRAGSGRTGCAGYGVLYRHVLVATIKEGIFRLKSGLTTYGADRPGRVA